MFKKMVMSAVFLCLSMWGLSPVPAQAVELSGAGATFPYPLYSKMFYEYHKQTGDKVNYQSIGSGGGIRQLMARTVDFGASDAFMSDEELSKAPAPIVHIPMALGAVVVTYNIPDNPTLKLTSDIVADIYLGKITKWDDQRIKNVNPGVDIPHLNITVVHRSDGSGTTFIFSNYLAKISRDWKAEVGQGKALDWPVGIGGKGNEGVAGYVKQIPGAIGYVELIYTLQNNMPAALVQNKSGNFINPSLESVSLAANIDLPDDTRIAITDTDAAQGYPISGFTWLLLYQEQSYGGRSAQQADESAKLAWWMCHQGQSYNEALHYAPIPKAAVAKAERILKSVTYQGKPILR